MESDLYLFILCTTGPALDGMKTLGDRKESFDVIFIDADKPNYANYYQVFLYLSMS